MIMITMFVIIMIMVKTVLLLIKTIIMITISIIFNFTIFPWNIEKWRERYRREIENLKREKKIYIYIYI